MAKDYRKKTEQARIALQPVTFTDHGGGWAELKCPNCKGFHDTYLHHTGVTVYNRREDAEATRVVNAPATEGQKPSWTARETHKDTTTIQQLWQPEQQTRWNRYPVLLRVVWRERP